MIFIVIEMREAGIILLCAILNYAYGSPAPPVYDTIVVGMGASGTAAATTLAQAGKKVLALEAQGRIGGRVNTVPFGDGIVEVGAEWIHGNVSSSTYELAVKNNVTILPQAYVTQVYFSDGSSDREDIVIDLTSFELAVSDELMYSDIRPKDPIPMGQYFTERIREYIKVKYPIIQNDTDFINGCLELLDMLVTTYESSNSWNDISTQSSARNLGGNQELSWHKYGYKTLFEILLNKYNNGPGYPTLEIKLNSEVTKIQWPATPEENVLVTVKDGTTYIAKNVIVTMSLGVLKERYKALFSPPLPEQKTFAIEAISFGLCDKMIFRFNEAWWLKDSFMLFVWRSSDKAEVSEEDKWLLKVNTIEESMASNTSFAIWACGDTAKKMETLSEDVVKTKVMWLIRKFMGVGKIIPEPIEMLRSMWYSNPFTRGSYSYENVDTPKHPTARADLAQPLVDSSGKPRVLFAGEATDSIHFATVHGAVDTGRREANRLLST